MREAMANAVVGDDVFGDDPTVNLLQERFAEIVGKEKALFVPSGSMANQIAVHCNTFPGDEVYCDVGCHVLNFEGGAAPMLSGVILAQLHGPRGAFRADDVEPRLRPPDHHFPPSRLIWVENSHNRAGGSIFPQEWTLGLRRLADEKGLKMHLDGARLWNVAAATGMSERELAAPFDSVNCCLSKGLGCPVGSLTAGTAEYIDRAHRARKRFGGGMRQAGILAAAGLYALDHHRTRLAEDHRRARRLAEAVAAIPAFEIDLEGVQTNIVIFDTKPGGRPVQELLAALRSAGVWATSFGSKIRMVTHLDLDDESVDVAIEALRRLFA